MIVQIDTDNFASPCITADALDHVGKALLAGGDVDDALAAFAAAAAADVALAPALRDADPVPWDGDETRAGLFTDLLRSVRPNAVLLFGAARGETAAWIATIFDGPILANEAEPRLFLQARELLARWHKVTTFNETPTTLLPMVLPILEGPVLVWLDKAFRETSPLADALGCIIDRLPRAVIVIDGPQQQPAAENSGYAPWPLASIEQSPIRLFVAAPPVGANPDRSDMWCVAAAGPDELAALAAVATLRPMDWTVWRINGLRAELAALRRYIGMGEH
jgi:hypothetical protein